MFPDGNFKLDYTFNNFKDNGTITFNSESVQHEENITPLKWTEELNQAILAVETLHETFTHICPKHLNAINRNCISGIRSYLHNNTGDICLSSLLCVAEEIIGKEIGLYEKQNSSDAATSQGTQNGVAQGCAEMDARQRDDNYS